VKPPEAIANPAHKLKALSPKLIDNLMI